VLSYRSHSLTALKSSKSLRIKQLILCAGDGGRQLGASTRQAVLIAVSSLGDALGPAHPKPFIAVLPALVAAAKDMHRSVRSSALAAAASCLAALGSAALPLLPKLVPAVLAAAQTAVDSLPISTPPQVLLPWCMSALWHSDAVEAPEYLQIAVNKYARC